MQQERRRVETGSEELLCHVEARVAVVTLARPEARNALTLGMKDALRALLPALDDDRGVGCVLLTGAKSSRSFASSSPPRTRPPWATSRRRSSRNSALRRPAPRMA